MYTARPISNLKINCPSHIGTWLTTGSKHANKFVEGWWCSWLQISFRCNRWNDHKEHGSANSHSAQGCVCVCVCARARACSCVAVHTFARAWLRRAPPATREYCSLRRQVTLLVCPRTRDNWHKDGDQSCGANIQHLFAAAIAVLALFALVLLNYRADLRWLWIDRHRRGSNTESSQR